MSETPEFSGERPANGTVTAPAAAARTPREKVRSLPPVLVRVKVWVSRFPVKSVELREEGVTPATGGRMDEPVSGVDAAGGEIFIELLRKLQAEKHFTVVLVSHDLSVVSSHADHVICLNITVKSQGKTLEVLTPENIAKLYGAHSALHYHPGEKPGTSKYG